MILQNSTDIKTQYFTNENGDMYPVDVQYERHTINPNGLVQLQKIPSIHTVFDVTRKDGINVVKYNKVDVIINQTDFTVDYQNSILTFHISQTNKDIQVSYTNAIGRLVISADRIFTAIDNQGSIVNTLGKQIDDVNEALGSIKVIGDASTVIQQTQANIDAIRSLSSNLDTGIEVNAKLEKNITDANQTYINLSENINTANSKITEMDNWVNDHNDITNLDNRVNSAESKLVTVESQLVQLTNFKANGGSVGGSITMPNGNKLKEDNYHVNYVLVNGGDRIIVDIGNAGQIYGTYLVSLEINHNPNGHYDYWSSCNILLTHEVVYDGTNVVQRLSYTILSQGSTDFSGIISFLWATTYGRDKVVNSIGSGHMHISKPTDVTVERFIRSLNIIRLSAI